MCALTTLAPVSSVDNGCPLHVRIADGNEIHGFVQCEATRAIDLKSCAAEGCASLVGSIDDATLAEVLAIAKVVLGLDGV